MVIHVTCTTTSQFIVIGQILVNDPAEPSCLQWVETAGFTNPSQHWCTRSWGFHTVRGGIIRGGNRVRCRIIGVVDIRKAFCSVDGIAHSPCAGGFTNPSLSAISQWRWGFHTVRGGIDPEDHRSRPLFVGVVGV